MRTTKSLLASRTFQRFRESGLLTITILWIALFIYGSITVPYFFKATFWNGIFKTYAPCTLMAIGVAVLTIGGSFDMSCGSTASFCCVMTVYCHSVFGYNIALSCLIGVMSGVLCGYIKGALSTYLRIAPLLMTFAFSKIIEGVGQWMVPDASLIGAALDISKLYAKKPLGIPVSVWMILFSLLVWLVIKRTRLGIHIYALGNDFGRAYSTGIEYRKTRMLSFVYCGLMTGIAGLAITGVVATAQYDYAVPLNIQAIAACIVGGVFIGGGEGTVLGAALGSLFFGVLSSTVLASVRNIDYQALVSNLLVFLCIMIPSAIKMLQKKRI